MFELYFALQLDHTHGNERSTVLSVEFQYQNEKYNQNKIIIKMRIPNMCVWKQKLEVVCRFSFGHPPFPSHQLPVDRGQFRPLTNVN